jgi:hypothetical protein
VNAAAVLISPGGTQGRDHVATAELMLLDEQDGHLIGRKKAAPPLPA